MNPDHPKYNAELEETKALVMHDLAQQFPEKERQQLIGQICSLSYVARFETRVFYSCKKLDSPRLLSRL